MSNHEGLPDPRPPRQHPPFMELSFAALGWLARAADAAGTARFTESVQRARFNMTKAAGYAKTPAEVAVIAGLASSLEGLIQADADAREVLAASLSGLESVLDAGGVPPSNESSDAAEGIESEGGDVSQDPATGSCDA